MALTMKQSGQKKLFADEVKLLEDQTSITDGEWYRLGGRNAYSIQFKGIVDSTCQIRISNNYEDTLANSEHEESVGDDIIADQTIQMDAMVKFIKVRKTVAGTDTVNATLYVGA